MERWEKSQDNIKLIDTIEKSRSDIFTVSDVPVLLVLVSTIGSILIVSIVIMIGIGLGMVDDNLSEYYGFLIIPTIFLASIVYLLVTYTKNQKENQVVYQNYYRREDKLLRLVSYPNRNYVTEYTIHKQDQFQIDYDIDKSLFNPPIIARIQLTGVEGKVVLNYTLSKKNKADVERLYDNLVREYR